MKSISAGIIIIVLIISMVFVVNSQKKEPELIKIGAILPLTGDLAKFGASFKNGIDLALSDIQFNNGKIEIIYEDDQGKPEVAVSALKKLVEIDNVPIVIGGAISSTALAIASMAEKKNVALISPTATAPELSKFKTFFRMQPSDLFEGKIMAEFAFSELHKPKVAVIYVNNDWGKGLMNIFISEYKNRGGEIVYLDFFERETNDFKTILSKVKVKNPQRIYILGYLNELITFLRQATEIGLKTPFLSAYSFYDPEILKKVPLKILEDSYLTVPLYDPTSTDSIIKKFVENYSNKYQKTPDMFAAHSYDCMKLSIQTLQNCKSNQSDVVAYLKSITGFNGVTGKMKFRNGEIIKPYRIFVVKNGNYEFYKTINP